MPSRTKRPTKELLLTLGAALMFPACATIRPPQPPSLNLPQPPMDLHARRKGDKVLLTWTLPTLTTDRQTIPSRGPTRICRGVDPVLSQCGTPVGNAAPIESSAPAHPSTTPTQKIKASYADTLPSALESVDPDAYATYAVEALNTNGQGAGVSNQVRVPLASTLPPPADFSAHLTGEGVVLTWTKATATVSSTRLSYFYRVFRRSKNETGTSLVGELWDRDKTTLSLTDSTIEWEQTYSYHVEAITVAESGKAKVEIEGDDSFQVEIFAHDTFPPAVPAGVQAVFSGPGQQAFIDLIWAPVADMDLAGYNVYRYEAGAAPEKLNVDLVKSPAYRDTNVASGKNYLYSVSAVDVRSNESARSEEAGESVP